MITILFHAEGVGPICQKLARTLPDSISAVRDTDGIPASSHLLRWGSVAESNVEKQLNSAASVRVCHDKCATRKLLGDLAPPTWFRVEDIPYGTTCVVRPKKHHGGKSFRVLSTPREFAKAARILNRRGWYASKLIQKASEYRVFVLQGRVVCVSQRFPNPQGDVAWNLANGGRLINVRYSDWPVGVCKAGIAGAKKLGLDWAAMDIAVDGAGKSWVFEANTAPGLKNKYSISQISRALAWVPEHDTPKEAKGDRWQDLRHPALKDELPEILRRAPTPAPVSQPVVVVAPPPPPEPIFQLRGFELWRQIPGNEWFRLRADVRGLAIEGV